MAEKPIENSRFLCFFAKKCQKNIILDYFGKMCYNAYIKSLFKDETYGKA